MSAALTMVPEPSPGRLQVAVHCADPARRRALVALVATAGHEVAPPGEADVLLLEGEAQIGGRVPVVALGGAAEHAGMLPAEARPDQIDAALRAVAAGLLVRAPAADVVRGFAMVADPASPLLTPREMQVLASVGEGLSNKSAARALGISQHTVKFHLEAIYAKLGAAGRAEAVAKGLRTGLLEI